MDMDEDVEAVPPPPTLPTTMLTTGAVDVEVTVVKAIKIISYFRKSTRALAQLRELCDTPGFQFQIPTPTRWSSYYNSLKQLQDKQEHLENMAGKFPYSSDGHLLSTKPFITNEEVREIIRDTGSKCGFWRQLENVTNTLELYSIAPIIMESRHATLADAVFMWAKLHRGVSISINASINAEYREYVKECVNKRWKKIYHSVYLICWFLHPRYSPQNKDHIAIHSYLVNNLKTIARRLYVRLFANGNDKDRRVQNFTEQLVWFSSRTHIFGEDQTWNDKLLI